MPEAIDLLLRGVVMGTAGSAAMDAWSAVLRRRFGISTLDYRLLGRWIGHAPRGRFFHDRIASARQGRTHRAQRGMVRSWLARQDTNLDPPDPESGALPLSHAAATGAHSIARFPRAHVRSTAVAGCPERRDGGRRIERPGGVAAGPRCSLAA